MKAYEFCYWLQGYFELSGHTNLDTRQVDIVRKHLAMVFVHDIDASYPEEQQGALQAAHDGIKPTHAPNGEVLFRC